MLIPNIVNILLLTGIRYVLCQSEEFDDALERVKVLEIQNTETKLRLESLETWFLKLNDKVEDATIKIDTGGHAEDSEHLKNQVDTLNKEFSSLKKPLLSLKHYHHQGS